MQELNFESEYRRDDQQAVLLHVKLSNGDMGTETEDEPLYALAGRLQDAIEAAGAGEFDGDEWGNGYCIMFMYGADANRLFDAVIPIILREQFPRGSYMVKRHGGQGAEEQVVRL